MPYKDPEKQRAANKRWREKNKHYHTAQIRKWKRDNPGRVAAAQRRYAGRRKRYLRDREWLNGIKVAAGCALCEENRPVCLDFHHRDRKSKAFGVGTSMTRSRASIEKEIAKCIVLCANCHRVVTWGDG